MKFGILTPVVSLVPGVYAPWEEDATVADVRRIAEAAALRACFGRRLPNSRGPHFEFQEMIVDPCALQQDVPIWIGGRTPRSLRRAVELDDGWCPFAVSARRAAEWLQRSGDTQAWRERARPLEVILISRDPVDPSGSPEATIATVRELENAGATTMSLRFVHQSVGHCIEQLEAVAKLIADF